MTEKRCPRCEVTKPVESFAVCRGKKDGRQSWCKSCLAESRAARSPERRAELRRLDRERYVRNRERLLEQKRQYGWANREARIAYLKAWRATPHGRAWAEAHRDNARRASLKHARNNKADRVVAAKKWHAKNPDKVREYAHRRRATAANAPVNDFNVHDWRELLNQYDHRCAYCGAEGQMTQEHKIPLARGGSHTKSNIVPACGGCNFSKHTKTVDEFFAWMKEFAA